MENLKACNINFSMEPIGHITQSVQKVNSLDSFFGTLLDDKFYSDVASISDSIDNVSYDKLTCMSQKQNVDVCNNPALQGLDEELKMYHENELDKIIEVLDKYHHVIHSKIQWIENNVESALEKCNKTDSMHKLQKMRTILDRLAKLFEKNESINGNIKVAATNQVRVAEHFGNLTDSSNAKLWHFVSFVLIVLALVMVYLAYANKKLALST
jgi:hypothetical protein